MTAFRDPMVLLALALVLIGGVLAFTRVGDLPLFFGIGLLCGRVSRIVEKPATDRQR